MVSITGRGGRDEFLERPLDCGLVADADGAGSGAGLVGYVPVSSSVLERVRKPSPDPPSSVRMVYGGGASDSSHCSEKKNGEKCGRYGGFKDQSCALMR